MLQSRNVFIDTQAFLQNKFRFDHPALKQLLELGSSGLIQLVLTETIVGEVRAKLTEQLADAAKSLGQFHKLSGVVENIFPEQYQGLRSKPSEDELIELALKTWGTYLTDSKAIVASASAVNGADLLALYFASKPPFGDGRKKNEFPDAISVLSLSAWMKANQTNIYIVSQDNDLVSWCEQTPDAFHVKTLAEFIDLYHRAEEKLTELVHNLFKKEEAWFLDAIKTQFLQSGFVYADNWEAEVDGVDVHDISIHEVNIIEVEDARTLVSVTVEIEFSAEISGPDFDNGIWDSEDKKYIYLPDFSFEHTFNEQYEVFLDFEFSSETEEVKEILSITVEDGSDISLSIDDGYPYK